MSLFDIFTAARTGRSLASILRGEKTPPAKSDGTLEPLLEAEFERTEVAKEGAATITPLASHADPADGPTLDNLMAAVTEPERSVTRPAREKATADTRSAILAIVEACTAAGKPEKAEGFIREGLTLEAAQQRLADAAPPADAAGVRSTAAAIVTACEAAGVDYLAGSLIAANLSLDEARARIETAFEIRQLFQLGAKTAPYAIDAEMAKA